jgi:tetratricopeptide (TPR) repeat protein
MIRLCFLLCLLLGGCASNQLQVDKIEQSTDLLGKAHAAFLRGDRDGAIAECTEVIGHHPENAEAFCYRGLMYLLKDDMARTFADYSEAVRLEPKNAEAHAGVGDSFFYRDDYDRAIAAYNESLGLDPESASVFKRRGVAYCRKGDFNHGIADYSTAIRFSTQPSQRLFDRADGYYTRGIAYLFIGETAPGLADLHEAISIDPNSSQSFNVIAWTLATHADASVRNGPKALILASKACELSGWKIATFLDTLAAAYAENGNFEEAIKWENKSLELHLPNNAIKGARDRLQLYQRKEPYREPRHPGATGGGMNRELR